MNWIGKKRTRSDRADQLCYGSAVTKMNVSIKGGREDTPMAGTKKHAVKAKKAVSKSEGKEIAGVRKTVEQHFPHLWPAVEAGLSVCATLLLKHNVNPTALIYIGPASAGKTTVASMFEETMQEESDGCKLVYRSDQFTPASFVSQSATATREDLESIDLLPRIKHKVLLTPELATMFRGKADELASRFSTITRVLDGQGFTRDSGTHGQRGYTGDYLFAWIGCTTPFTDSIWSAMAQLGSRLLFFSLDSISQPTMDDLVQSVTRPLSYQQMLTECQQCVQTFLKPLFSKLGGVRTIHWDQKKTSKKVARTLAGLASLLAIMRTLIEGDGPTQPESPHRAYAVLHHIAQGHAIIGGRRQLTDDDLPLVARIALSSMPFQRRAVLEAFARHSGEPLSVTDVCEAVDVTENTARKIMEQMDKLKIAHYDQRGNGKASLLTLSPKWTLSENTEMWDLIGKITTSQKSGDVLAVDKNTIS